jgi:hypothetical protein
VPAEPSSPFVAARHRRAELLAAITALECALAAPSAEPGWSEHLRDQVEVLRHSFADHVAVTEAPDGMYADILHIAPRLSRGVQRLVAEHDDATVSIEALAKLVDDAPPDADPAWVDLIRDEATELLARLVRHRQRGADLVFEAYQRDIGGCD